MEENYNVGFLDSLEFFFKALKESETSEEFTMSCVMNGYRHLCTKKFFDEVLFDLITKSSAGIKIQDLKYINSLRDNLSKLQDFYKSFVL